MQAPVFVDVAVVVNGWRLRVKVVADAEVLEKRRGTAAKVVS